MYICDVFCSDGGNEFTLRDETGAKYTVTAADFKRLEIPFSDSADNYPFYLEDEAREVISLMSEKLRCIKYLRYYISSYGSKSVKRLLEKCRENGYSTEAASRATELLIRLSVINEDSDCLRRVESMAQTKLFGRYRIKSELIQKGYSSKSIEYALENAEVDYFENAGRLYEKLTKHGVPEDVREKKKIADKMTRYGYSYQEIKYATSIEYRE